MKVLTNTQGKVYLTPQGKAIESKGGSGGLPDEYQEVEYIQTNNSGDQYIDTNVLPSSGIRITFDIEFTDMSLSASDYIMIAGSRTDSSHEYYAGVQKSTSHFMWRPALSGSVLRRYYNTGTVVLGARYVVQFGPTNSDIIVNGNADVGYVSSAATSLSTAKIRLMSLNDYAAHPSRYYAKYRHARLEDVNLGIDINLTPCYRKADGVIGMYDTVGKVFYTNSGTGAFLKGADIITADDLLDGLESIL